MRGSRYTDHKSGLAIEPWRVPFIIGKVVDQKDLGDQLQLITGISTVLIFG